MASPSKSLPPELQLLIPFLGTGHVRATGLAVLATRLRGQRALLREALADARKLKEHRIRAFVLAAVGRAERSKGILDEAADAALRNTFLPEYAIHEVGMAFAELGAKARVSELAEALERIAELGDEHHHAVGLAKAAELRAATGRRAEARKLLEQSFRHAGKDFTALQVLAQACRKVGDTALAERVFEARKRVALSSNSLERIFRERRLAELGGELIDLGRTPAGIALLERATKGGGGENAEVLAEAALHFARAKRSERATELFTKAVERARTEQPRFQATQLSQVARRQCQAGRFLDAARTSSSLLPGSDRSMAVRDTVLAFLREGSLSQSGELVGILTQARAARPRSPSFDRTVVQQALREVAPKLRREPRRIVFKDDPAIEAARRLSVRFEGSLAAAGWAAALEKSEDEIGRYLRIAARAAAELFERAGDDRVTVHETDYRAGKSGKLQPVATRQLTVALQWREPWSLLRGLLAAMAVNDRTAIAQLAAARPGADEGDGPPGTPKFARALQQLLSAQSATARGEFASLARAPTRKPGSAYLKTLAAAALSLVEGDRAAFERALSEHSEFSRTWYAAPRFRNLPEAFLSLPERALRARAEAEGWRVAP